MTPAYRRLLKVSRTAHLYLTLFGLMLILFFAITGFMLNHEDWFLSTEPILNTREGSMSPIPEGPVDKFTLAESLRKQFLIPGYVNSFQVDDDQIELEFLRPGERTMVEIKRESGEVAINSEKRGWMAVATDLHKGKSAGWLWSLVIDGVCVLLLAVSATGLVLWSSLKSRGNLGLIAMIGGTLMTVAIYLWAVP